MRPTPPCPPQMCKARLSSCAPSTAQQAFQTEVRTRGNLSEDARSRPLWFPGNHLDPSRPRRAPRSSAVHDSACQPAVQASCLLSRDVSGVSRRPAIGMSVVDLPHDPEQSLFRPFFLFQKHPEHSATCSLSPPVSQVGAGSRPDLRCLCRVTQATSVQSEPHPAASISSRLPAKPHERQ